ncbi:monocarboxylate transporter 14-like [Glandiceps talaboti]
MALNPPNGGYGWIVALGGFIIYFLLGGQVLSFGILYVEFLNEFGASKSSTGFWFWILSLPTLGNIGKYFTTRLPLAMGLVLSGTGAGQFALSFIIHLLLDKYGWRGTLFILAAVNLHICVAGALNRPVEVYRDRTRNDDNTGIGEVHYHTDDKRDIENTGVLKDSADDRECSHYSNKGQHTHEVPPTLQTSQSSLEKCHEEGKKSRVFSCGWCTSYTSKLRNGFKNTFDWSLFCIPAFVLIVVTAFGSQAGNYSISSHIVKRGRDLSIPSLRSSSLPAIMGLTQFLGRVFWGVVGGVSQRLKPTMLYGGSIGAAGIVTIISVHTVTYTGQLTYVILLGVCMACFIPTFPIVMRQLLGASKLDHSMIFYLQAQALGAMIVSPFVGWMRDVQGYYNGAFYFLGSLYLVSAICAFLAPITNQCVVKNKEQQEENRYMDDSESNDKEASEKMLRETSEVYDSTVV